MEPVELPPRRGRGLAWFHLKRNCSSGEPKPWLKAMLPPGRPKGMHRATYKRLRNQMLEAEDVAIEGVFWMVQRIHKRNDKVRECRGDASRARSGRNPDAGRH